MNFPSRKTITSSLLLILSNLFLGKSSINSLIILTLKTKIKGIIAVNEFNGDIIGILWIIVINKKYKLGSRENWKSNPFGRKVNILYLVVVIVLFFNLNSAFFLLLFIKNSIFDKWVFSLFKSEETS